MGITLQQLNKKNGNIITELDIKKIDDNNVLIQETINSLPTPSKVESSTLNGNIKIDEVETSVYIHPSGTNPHGTTKEDVGLGNVINESKGTMFTDPIFTGIPKAPTATKGNNTTQIATTAFVQTELNSKIVALTASEYSAIVSPDANTLYLIKA